MNIEDFVFAPKKEKKEKTCGKKIEQFWFLLTTMTVTKKERKKIKRKKSSLSKFTTWFMFADIYLIVIGQKQKKDQKFTKSKEKKGKSKQR